ncbi:MAG: BTAD domain-containing putative transcriptional regulator [Gemmatimonadales bacterium]
MPSTPILSTNQLDTGQRHLLERAQDHNALQPASSAAVQLRTLGVIDLLADDEARAARVLTQPKRIGLLAYLAVSGPGTPVRRDTLTGMLWPEHDDQHARGALRQALHGLRTGLGEDVVVNRGDGEVGLDPERFWCDAVAFQSVLERGDQSEAVRLYSGPFLNGLRVREAPGFVQWMDRERSRLARAHETALEQLAAVAEDDGDLLAAAEWWERLLESDPYNARAVIRLMELLEALGEPARAIEHAEQHAMLLHEELNAAPNPDVEKLADRLRTHPKAVARVRGQGQDMQAPQAAEQPSQRDRKQRDGAGNRRRWFLLAAFVIAAAILGWFSRSVYMQLGDTGIPGMAVITMGYSGPEEDRFLAEGTTDAIATQLVAMPGLRVKKYPDSSEVAVGQYASVGKALGVEYLLVGHMYVEEGDADGRQLRVNTELISASDHELILSDTYVGPVEMRSLFRFHRDVARNIARRLDAALFGSHTDIAVSIPTDNVEAWEYYLQGQQHWNRGSLHNRHAHCAIRMFEDAVALDSNFTLAYAGLAKVHSDMWTQTRDPFHLAEAERALERTLALEPEGRAVGGARASYASARGEHELAQVILEEAVRANPNDAELLVQLGEVQLRLNLWDAALVNLERAFELDPQLRRAVMSLAETYLCVRRFEDARRTFQAAIRLGADEADGYGGLAWLTIASGGTTEDAERILSDGIQLIGSVEVMRWLVATDGYLSWFLLLGDDFHVTLDEFTVVTMGADSADYYLARASSLQGRGKEFSARVYYDSATAVLQARVDGGNEGAIRHGLLGVAYAGAGHSLKGVAAARKGVELLPVSRNAYTGPRLMSLLARAHTLAGEYGAAVDMLQDLLDLRSYYSVDVLRLHPAFDPLRANARFKRLVGEQEW